MNTIEQVVNGNIKYEIVEDGQTTIMKANNIELTYIKVPNPKFTRLPYTLLSLNKQQSILDKGWELSEASMTNQYGTTSYRNGHQFIETSISVRMLLELDELLLPSLELHPDVVAFTTTDLSLSTIVNILNIDTDNLNNKLTLDVEEAIDLKTPFTDILYKLKGCYVKTVSVLNSSSAFGSTNITYNRTGATIYLLGCKIPLVCSKSVLSDTISLLPLPELIWRSNLKTLAESLCQYDHYYLENMSSQSIANKLVKVLKEHLELGFTIDYNNLERSPTINEVLYQAQVNTDTGKYLPDLLLQSFAFNKIDAISDSEAIAYIDSNTVKFKLAKLGLLERTYRTIGPVSDAIGDTIELLVDRCNREYPEAVPKYTKVKVFAHSTEFKLKIATRVISVVVYHT